MSYRFMRLLIMFDLPTLTSADKREYRKFRKYLIKNGFVMMEESVYTKLALNQTAADLDIKNVRKNKPISGIVAALIITEKQFSGMEYIVGEHNSEVLEDDNKLVVL